MKERETPETDGAAWPVEMVHQESNYKSWVRTDFARKLERERDEARADAQSAKDIATEYGMKLDDALRQRDEALAALEALRKAALPFPLEEIENISDGEDEMIPMRDVPAATTIYYDDGPTAADHSALSEAIAAARSAIDAVKGGK